MKDAVPNLLGIGRNGQGGVYIEAFDRLLVKDQAINAAAWLNLMLLAEQDLVAKAMAGILGEDAAAPEVGTARLQTIRLELERMVTRGKVGLVNLRPGVSQRQYMEGYVEGLERALGMLAGAARKSAEPGGPSITEANGGNEEPKPHTP